MTRADELFSRQARWQRSRRNLSWPEKIREAERLRPSVEAFRQMRMSRGVRAAGQLQDGRAAVVSQRPHARARLVPLHQNDGQFDREFWQSVPRGERVAALWQMVQDWAEWRGVPTDELRLQRSVCRVERGRR
jgi:hypothetical protein